MRYSTGFVGPSASLRFFESLKLVLYTPSHAGLVAVNPYLVLIANSSFRFMHTDQITIQPPIRSLAVGMNMMFFLTDVTAENGGTLVMPGSHKGNLAPDDPWNPVDTVAASGPAGTCMVFESRLWHATGANTVPGSERPVLLLYFTRPWMRQQENFSLSLKDEVYEQCSDRVKAFLGFKMSGTIGGVQGLNATEGSIVRRPHTDEYIGVLGVGSLDK
jgi:hypothetical protein